MRSRARWCAIWLCACWLAACGDGAISVGDSPVDGSGDSHDGSGPSETLADDAPDAADVRQPDVDGSEDVGDVPSNCTAGESCDDGDPCTVTDSCKDGHCMGTAKSCDDNNVCTTDSCEAAAGCTHTANTAVCNDGDDCTTGDQCAGGACLPGTINVCPCQTDAECSPYQDANPCNGSLWCATLNGTGSCTANPATVVVCDDSGTTPCSVAVCDPVDGLCKPAAAHTGQPCEDGNACTTGESCLGALCQPAQLLSCDDSNLCTADSCDPVVGCKHVLGIGACDDGFACTVDACDPTSGCANTPSDPTACTVSVPFAEPFTCDTASLGLWQRSDALLPSGAAKWAIDAAPVVPAPHSEPCTLNLNNGKSLQCAPGQTAIQAWAASPIVNLQSLAVGTPMGVSFYSAGDWATAATAVFSMQIDGGAWQDFGPVARSAVWLKQLHKSTAWAGHLVRFRFSLQDGCGDVDNPGWFIDDFAVFVDVCATQPAACGPTAKCAMGLQGLLDCSNCTTGYAYANGSCADVNECASTTTWPCGKWAQCANTIGGYVCSCKPGFTGDGQDCKDIDECALGTANCAANAECLDHDGGYYCACPNGTTGDGTYCGTLGGFPQLAAESCLAILQKLPGSTDGTYWLDFDGSGPMVASQFVCDMKNGGWTRLYADDFETSQGGWSAGTVNGCGAIGNVLGGYGQFGAGVTVSKSVATPPHTLAKLTLNYIRLDSWDNEYGFVAVDGKQVWSKQGLGVWFAGLGNLCGDGMFPDEEWDLGNGWADQHSAPTFTVSVSSNLDQSATDESFAIDNVVVFVK